MRTRRLPVIVALLVAALLATACTDSDDPSVAGPDDGDGAASGPTITFVPLEPGAITFQALQDGDVEIALLFSTQGIIAEQGWVVLEDDRTLQGSDNLVPLVRSEVLDGTVESVLDAVSAALTTEELTELNRRVDSEREDTDAVARDFLTEKGLLDGEPGSGQGAITVGSANFSEAEIVAQMYRLALEHAGYEVRLRAQLGSREVLIPALEAGEIDVEPEYLQSLLVYFDDATPSVTPEEGVALAAELLPEGLQLLTPSPAQDQNALVVTAETAERYGLRRVSDLLNVTDTLRMAGPPECPQRPLCIPGYRDVYGLRFDV